MKQPIDHLIDLIHGVIPGTTMALRTIVSDPKYGEYCVKAKDLLDRYEELNVDRENPMLPFEWKSLSDALGEMGEEMEQLNLGG